MNLFGLLLIFKARRVSVGMVVVDSKLPEENDCIVDSLLKISEIQSFCGIYFNFLFIDPFVNVLYSVQFSIFQLFENFYCCTCCYFDGFLCKESYIGVGIRFVLNMSSDPLLFIICPNSCPGLKIRIENRHCDLLRSRLTRNTD